MKGLLVLGVIVLALLLGYYYGKPKDCGANCLDTPMQQSLVTTVQASEFKANVEKGVSTILDVRTKEEFESGHIEGATNSDFYQTSEFLNYLDSLDQDREYLIYCRSGNRSGQALELMKEKGFKRVTNLSGGLSSWSSNNYPLVN